MTSADEEKTSIADRLPAEVALREIGLSFSLPKGKNLSRTWQRELRTEAECRVRLRVSKDRLEISCEPPILVDAQWPAMNMQLGGARLRFSDARIDVYLSTINGVAEGLIDFSDDARKQVAELIAAGIAGSAMAAPGYDPMADPAVMETLEAIADGAQKLPSSGKSDVSAADFSGPRVDVTLEMRKAFVFEKDGAGLALPEGGAISVRVSGEGKLAAIVASKSTAEGVHAARLSSLTLSSDALAVTYGGKNLAMLMQVRIDRGGVVNLEKMRLQGTLEEAASLESLGRIIAKTSELVGVGVSVEQSVGAAAISPDAQAQIVPGLVRGKIEAALAEGVRRLVEEYRWAIPGLDLHEIAYS